MYIHISVYIPTRNGVHVPIYVDKDLDVDLALEMSVYVLSLEERFFSSRILFCQMSNFCIVLNLVEPCIMSSESSDVSPSRARGCRHVDKDTRKRQRATHEHQRTGRPFALR